MVEQLYADQREWAGRLQSLRPSRSSDAGDGPTARAAFMVRATGLDQFFRQRGMPEARVNSCLADMGASSGSPSITRRGASEAGTAPRPSRSTAKVAEGVGTWPALEQRLRAAIGG